MILKYRFCIYNIFDASLLRILLTQQNYSRKSQKLHFKMTARRTTKSRNKLMVFTTQSLMMIMSKNIVTKIRIKTKTILLERKEKSLTKIRNNIKKLMNSTRKKTVCLGKNKRGLRKIILSISPNNRS